MGQEAKADAGRNFVVAEISSVDDADRDAHTAICPGPYPHRFIHPQIAGGIMKTFRDSIDSVFTMSPLFTRALQRSNHFVQVPIRNLAGDAGNNGESMDKNCEPQETDDFQDGSYKEMEYRLTSLRSLVCDLLKTNQELRSALLDAGIDTHSSRTSQERVRLDHRA